MRAEAGKGLGQLLCLRAGSPRYLKGASLLLFLFLSGCVVPNAVTYYAPTMAGGKVVERGRCVPTKSVMEFGALPLHAAVTRVAGNRWMVLVNLPLPKPPRPAWRQFHFQSADFYFRFATDGRKVPAKSITVSRDDHQGSLLIPYASSRPRHWSYYVDVWLPQQPGKAFDFYLPPVVIDGTVYHYPPIHFEKQIWVGISPFNC